MVRGADRLGKQPSIPTHLWFDFVTWNKCAKLYGMYRISSRATCEKLGILRVNVVLSGEPRRVSGRVIALPGRLRVSARRVKKASPGLRETPRPVMPRTLAVGAYQFFGLRNQNQRSVLESKSSIQWPSSHSSVAFRQPSGTCG